MLIRRSSALLFLAVLAACQPAGAPAPEYRPEEAGTLDHALCLLGFTAVDLDETPTGHHLVEARINGREGHFLLDTGANASVVHEAFAAHFRLPNGSDGPGGAVGVGGLVKTRQVRINGFAVGDVVIRQHRIAVADLGQIAQALGTGSGQAIHGIIFQDVLNEHRGVIDVKGQRLHMIVPDEDPRPAENPLCKSDDAEVR